MSERFILIGHPVGHSLSPAIHTAAYREWGRAAHYELVDCPDESAVALQIEALRRGEIQGANVTVPWKKVALALADRVDESARLVGAANVLARASDGAIVAHNTDARGLAGDLEELLQEGGGWRRTKHACVIGNGGAALGAVVACRLAGAEHVSVVARRFRADRPKSEWPGGDQMERLGAELVAWPLGDVASTTSASSWDEVVGRTCLFVQATSAGMQGADSGDTIASLVPWRAIPPAAAYDLVYNPAQTPFLEEAAAAGHRVRGGLGMLVRQAALAIEIWWGRLPTIPLLLAAAQGELHARAQQVGARGEPS